MDKFILRSDCCRDRTEISKDFIENIKINICLGCNKPCNLVRYYDRETTSGQFSSNIGSNGLGVVDSPKNEI